MACCRVAFVVVLAGCAGAATSSHAQTWLGGNGNWEDDLNWDTGSQPNAAGAVVLIDGGGGPSIVNLSSVRSIGDATIGDDDELVILNGGRLDLFGTITNNGVVRLRDLGAGTAAIRLSNGNAALNGTGTLLFDSSSSNNEITSGSSAWSLTIGEQQTVATSAGSSGAVRVNTVNNGEVLADAGTITFGTSRSVTNNATLRATNGGVIDFTSNNTINGSGSIIADAGSLLRFNGSTINNATIAGDGGVELANTNTYSNVTLDIADYRIVGGARVDLTSSLTNNTDIKLDDNGAGVASLRLDNGNAGILGNGTITFVSSADNLLTTGSSAWTMTIGEGQAVSTASGARGRIDVDTILDGTMVADDGIIQIEAGHNVTNNAADFRATNGGSINFLSDNTLSNNAAITADAGSSIVFNGTSYAGGSIVGAGTLNINGTTSFSNATLDIDRINIGGSDTLRLNSGMTNNGRIEINDQEAGNALIQLGNGNATIDGSGEIVFASGGGNLLTTSSTAWTLTLGTNQTVRVDSGNSGGFDVDTINNGSILADAAQVEILAGHTLVNNGTVRLENSSVLGFASNNTLSSTGTIEATDAGSRIVFNSTSVTGGAISGSGTLELNGTNTFAGATLNIARVALDGGDTLRLNSTITNNGRIDVADTDSGSALISLNNGNASILGGGEIVFGTTENNIIATGSSAWALTVGGDQTVRTADGAQGEFDVNTFVNGSVVADAGRITIGNGHIIDNTGSVRATNGGVFELNPGAELRGAGEFSADATSGFVTAGVGITNATISGDGLLDLGGANTFAGATLDIAETRLGGGDTVNLNGNLALNGTLRLVDTDSGNAVVSLSNGNATISGSGVLEFASSEKNRLSTASTSWGLTIANGMVATAGAGNRGEFDVNTTLAGTFDIDGEFVFENGHILSVVTDGVVTGGGVLDIDQSGNVFNNAGTLAPGSGAGVLTIEGSVNNEAGARLAVEIGGSGEGTLADLLVVTGDFEAGNSLSLIVDFVGAGGSLSESDTVRIVDAGSLTGGEFFASVALVNGSEGEFDIVFDGASGDILLTNFRNVVVPAPATLAVFAAVFAGVRRRSLA